MRKILLIYTGGTIGMISNAQSGALESFDFAHLYAHIPELKRFELAIEVKSFDTPLDSSEINPLHWKVIASWITEAYDSFDGFVVLHGTDTMSYTGSALSYMLQGLRKPVILTGSQLPIGIIRTDGKENIITAIEMAAAHNEVGEAILQEVAIYFESSLFRANRSSKISAHQFKAFATPNYPLLAKAGVQIEWFKENLFRTPLLELQPVFELDKRVIFWHLFPGMPIDLYAKTLEFPKVQILILETFGVGNAFSEPSFQALLQEFIANGGLILNITQCQSGAVQQGAYQTSTFFEKIGVISGADLTAEAALTKAMFAVANLPQQQRAAFLKSNIVGELSCG